MPKLSLRYNKLDSSITGDRSPIKPASAKPNARSLKDIKLQIESDKKTNTTNLSKNMNSTWLKSGVTKP